MIFHVLVIIMELFDTYPTEVLNNMALPKRVFTKLFNLVLSILMSPVGESVNRIFHQLQNLEGRGLDKFIISLS